VFNAEFERGTDRVTGKRFEQEGEDSFPGGGCSQLGGMHGELCNRLGQGNLFTLFMQLGVVDKQQKLLPPPCYERGRTKSCRRRKTLPPSYNKEKEPP